MSAALPDVDAPGGRAARPAPGLWDAVKVVLKPLASLQLTVALMALSVVLVFFGTVAQKHAGIWTVVDQYFWSWVVFIDPNLALDFTRIFFKVPGVDTKFPDWLRVPFPGGKVLGFLMFANLLAAHLVRMKFGVKRLGVITLHSGLVLLFVGEYVTREFQVEQQMSIAEGGSANYAVDNRKAELAFTVPDGSDERVTVVPASLLVKAKKAGEKLSHPDLPVDVEVKEFYRNSDLADVGPKEEKPNPATVGIGTTVRAVEKPEISGTDPDQKFDAPSAYVTLYPKGKAEPLATYMLTCWMDRPQAVPLDGKEARVALRFVRHYKPFEIHLNDFKFDRFVGTNTAKNYSSDVRLVDPEYGQDRELTIRMNEPLRHRGETFYQSSFTPDEKGTVLQVVRNPGWVLPYLSCVMVTVGMLLHFGLNLSGYLTKLKARPVEVAASAAPAGPKPGKWLVVGAVGLAALYVAGSAMPKGDKTAFPLNEFGQLPVVEKGRVKPLDTAARVDLRLITHKESFDADGKSRTAVEWFLDAASATDGDRGPAAKYRLFRIENDQVLELLKLKRRDGLRYSLDEMAPQMSAFFEAVQKADAKRGKGGEPDLFEKHCLELAKHVQIYLDVWQGKAPLVFPPAKGEEWRPAQPPREAVAAYVRGKMAELNLPGDFDAMNKQQKEQFEQLIDEGRSAAARAEPASAAWHGMLGAWRTNSPADFRKHLAEYQGIVADRVPQADVARAKFEAYLNGFAPFWVCLVLYGTALVMTMAGWGATLADPAKGEAVRRATVGVLLLTFALHTFALISRMYLSDRWLVFVTNLYSSAVFIGWAACGICLILERIYRLSIGNAVAAALGLGTCIIGHNLAASGDTLEMMQAVLDTNFWLATHVTTVTLGYSATYIAGAIGVVYIALGTATTLLRNPVRHGSRPADLGKVLGQMMYGIICLATLLSFVGTVLGGIWADQSWGRFWGWDPKENGAVLIVLWNAMILHARWCGLVKDRGVAILAVAGNMITTWSWFGTNQLGVGLHAYGFSNTLAFGCAVTWIVHASVMLLGLVPKHYWASFAASDAAKV